MTISTTKNTWESIYDLFSSIEIKESSIEIKESSIEIKRSFSIHLETVVSKVPVPTMAVIPSRQNERYGFLSLQTQHDTQRTGCIISLIITNL
jgi:hypothetical protein